MAASPKLSAAPPGPHPHIYVIDSFVIEAYSSIADVPYASVSEQRGKTLKTSEHERFDELYGRCRTCMGHKSGEQLLLCDDCDRGFHMTCLVPILRDVPKGEWHCPKCTRERVHNSHVRATAVANMKKVMTDVGNRPSLPLKLQLKLLDIAAPVVEVGRIIPQEPNGVHSTKQVEVAILPPKCRLKRPRQMDESKLWAGKEDTPVCLTKTSRQNVEKRLRSISSLASELAPIANLLNERDASNKIKYVQDHLWTRWGSQNGSLPESLSNGLGSNQHPPHPTRRTTRRDLNGNASLS